MKFIPDDDTIVALSTPLGNGAIAVIRLSGPESLSISNRLLKTPIGEDQVRQAIFSECHGIDHAELIDQVVATYFRGPASYSGEDIVEISCHCNTLIINSIIENLLKAGGRIAEPGEFTLRAFLKGKMDLSQAEAVAAVINSRTRQSLSQSLRHLEGRLSGRVGEIKAQTLNYLSLLEINLDFSDEEIEVMPMQELAGRIQQTREAIDRLLHTYDYGRFLQEGIKILILGKPNAGKSSLLNLLVEKDRAIVSDIPGTTRDYIEANLDIDGLAVVAVDTAGIRQTEDQIEAIGVQRALEHLKSADIALCLFEAHKALDKDDIALKSIIRDHHQDVDFVLVLNKGDLGQADSVKADLEPLNLPMVSISAKTASGLDDLKAAIKAQVISDESLESEEVVVTSARHKTALEKTIESLNNAEAAIAMGASDEIIAVDLRLALDHLGEITGETTSDDVLNHIFSNFCIGK